jgi:hypothetical protein
VGAADKEVDETDDSGSCEGQSFTAETGVVLASGAVVPISQVKVGDKVRTTDPSTGKVTTQAVTAVWLDHDTDLMDVTVSAAGVVSVIHATQRHPFWDVTRHAWVNADQLRSGDQLATADGVAAVVAGTRVVPGAGDMWDLTVANNHDFYVIGESDTLSASRVDLAWIGWTVGSSGAGFGSIQFSDKKISILVHNCNNDPIWTSRRNFDSVQNAYNHWVKHGEDFPNLMNAKQYVEQAKSFLRNPGPDVQGTVRDNGDVVRFDSNTQEFGAMTEEGTPRTYYRPDPDSHGYPTNQDYFDAQ